LALGLNFYATIMVYLERYTKFKMFSMQETKKYFKRNPSNNLNIFNGVKSLAMLWVIFGHVGGNYLKHSINYMNE
jgi:hypothetical protein